MIFPIFIPHQGCPFKCIYCNQHLAKYTHKQKPFNKSTSPAQPLSTINCQLSTITEVAFYGGSFTCLNKPQMQAYFDQVSPYIDEHTTFRLSTRPDAITPEILDFLKTNKVTTIELGVQSFDDDELTATQRGYTAQTAIDACKLIKEWDISLVVQLLIGLPSVSSSQCPVTSATLKNIQTINYQLSTINYIRLYPLLVLKDTHLETLYRAGKYTPLTIEQAAQICLQYLRECERLNIPVIKIGLHSDLSPADIVAGPYHPHFGEIVRGLHLVDKIIAKPDISHFTISNKSASQLNAYNKYAMKVLKSHLPYISIKVDPTLQVDFIGNMK